MSGERIRARPEEIAAVRDAMSREGIGIGEEVGPFGRTTDLVGRGAGEFEGDLAHDLAGFELSWSAALQAMSTSVGNLAANIGGFGIDLVAVDLDLAD